MNPTTNNAVTAVPDPNVTPTPGDPPGGTTPPSGGTTPPSGSPSGSPAPSSMTQAGNDLGSQLKAWIAMIPDLMLSHTLGRSAIRATATVPIAFVDEATTAVESSPELEGVNKLDIAASHSAVDYATGFEPVVKLLRKAATDLQFTIDTKKSVVATQALQVYEVSKALSRDASGANLLPYVDAMKKALGRRGAKKGGTTPTPTPAPTTPPATPPPATPPAAATPAVAPTSVSMTATVPAGSTTTHS